MDACTNCESCVYFDLVDDDGTMGCTMSLDEDEMVHYLTGRSAGCPYYRFYDEYKSVQKQN